MANAAMIDSFFIFDEILITLQKYAKSPKPVFHGFRGNFHFLRMEWHMVLASSGSLLKLCHFEISGSSLSSKILRSTMR